MTPEALRQEGKALRGASSKAMTRYPQFKCTSQSLAGIGCGDEVAA